MMQCESSNIKAVPLELAVEFLIIFTRFEYAMKEAGYRRDDGIGLAVAAWQRLGNEAAVWIGAHGGQKLSKAVELLNAFPPKIQSVGGGWQTRALRGANPVAQAIDAATRVKNNLFHEVAREGDEQRGCDEQLVVAALTLLTALIETCPPVLRSLYQGRGNQASP